MRVLITGACGNLGTKLARHLEGRYDLVLLGHGTHGDATLHRFDLSKWEEA